MLDKEISCKKKNSIESSLLTKDIIHIYRDYIPNICKELLKLNNKKQPIQSEIQTKGLNRYHTKEDLQTANKHMKKCATSYVFGEINIKTTLQFKTH